jgi:hypothetical protein
MQPAEHLPGTPGKTPPETPNFFSFPQQLSQNKIAIIRRAHGAPASLGGGLFGWLTPDLGPHSPTKIVVQSPSVDGEGRRYEPIYAIYDAETGILQSELTVNLQRASTHDETMEIVSP